VFRNEKPGPGRFRQFMQFDADTVGSASPVADAEVCMMAADTMEALGLERGQYVVRINNRKILDGVLESVGLGEGGQFSRRLIVLRALDKFDRLGEAGLIALLGEGRKDESGDFTPGAGLNAEQIDGLLQYIRWKVVRHDKAEKGVLVHAIPSAEAIIEIVFPENANALRQFALGLKRNPTLDAGIEELIEMVKLFDRAGYDSDRITFDPTIVRGLEYYTGPVFECELLMETKDEDGRTVRFGSVGGGGRYDDLVARFTGQQVPATGFSIGVSRLYSALERFNKTHESSILAPVVVLVMDKDRQGDYWRMVQQLRAGGVRAEMYAGTAGMKAQMKYADKRGAPLVVIQGGDEKDRGEVQIKDLRLGTALASNIESREEYASQRLAQFSVPEAELVSAVKKALDGR
jgi:histidyl-tRNA synthetase